MRSRNLLSTRVKAPSLLSSVGGLSCSRHWPLTSIPMIAPFRFEYIGRCSNAGARVASRHFAGSWRDGAAPAQPSHGVRQTLRGELDDARRRRGIRTALGQFDDAGLHGGIEILVRHVV